MRGQGRDEIREEETVRNDILDIYLPYSSVNKNRRENGWMNMWPLPHGCINTERDPGFRPLPSPSRGTVLTSQRPGGRRHTMVKLRMFRPDMRTDFKRHYLWMSVILDSCLCYWGKETRWNTHTTTHLACAADLSSVDLTSRGTRGRGGGCPSCRGGVTSTERRK